MWQGVAQLYNDRNKELPKFVLRLPFCPLEIICMPRTSRSVLVTLPVLVAVKHSEIETTRGLQSLISAVAVWITASLALGNYGIYGDWVLPPPDSN